MHEFAIEFNYIYQTKIYQSSAKLLIFFLIKFNYNLNLAILKFIVKLNNLNI